jgi:hypothetical protein
MTLLKTSRHARDIVTPTQNDAGGFRRSFHVINFCLVLVKRAMQVTWYMALAMSLIAGIVGALVGKVAFG